MGREVRARLLLSKKTASFREKRREGRKEKIKEGEIEAGREGEMSERIKLKFITVPHLCF